MQMVLKHGIIKSQTNQGYYNMKIAEILKVTLPDELNADHTKPEVWEMEGTLDDRPFTARSIQWKGEPIFKLHEEFLGVLTHLSLAKSSWGRGDRIAVARACKAHLDKFFPFGNIKEKVEPELKAGELVNIAAETVKDENPGEGEPHYESNEVESCAIPGRGPGEVTSITFDKSNEGNWGIQYIPAHEG